MRKPLFIGGPWKGIAPSYSPHVVPNEVFADGRAFRFHNGRAMLAPTFVASNPLPIVSGGSRISNLLRVFFIRIRNASDKVLYLTRSGAYAGDIYKVQDITSNSGWSAEPDDIISMVHMPREVEDWVVISSSRFPHLFRWNTQGGVLQKFEATRDEDHLPILAGRYLSSFDNRLILLHPRTSVSEIPHGVAWYGIYGPFDTEFPTAGQIELTDIPGPVTGVSQVQDYMAVFKPYGIYLGQKTYDPNLPFVFTARVSGVGCQNYRAIASILDGMAIAFLGVDREFYVYDAQRPVAVGQPVRDILRAYSDMDAIVSVDPDVQECHIAYPDLTLVWHLREGWWSIDDNSHGSYDIIPGYVSQTDITIDELVGTIDQQSGLIDDYSGSEVELSPLLATDVGLHAKSYEVVREGWLRTKEIRFPKPITMTRFVVRVRALRGGVLMMRRSENSGRSWYAWQELIRGDADGTVRAAYDFVSTSEQYLFELYFTGRHLILEDWQADVVVASEDEDVTMLSGDFNTSGWNTYTIPSGGG